MSTATTKIGQRVTVNRGNLQHALQMIQPVVPRSHIDSVVNGNMLFNWTENGEVMLRGTDYSSYMEYRFEAISTEGSGSALIPLQAVHGLLKEIHQEDLTLQVSGESIHLESDHGSFDLRIEKASAFPEAPRIEEVCFVSIEAQALTRAIEMASIATSSEEGHYAFDSILFEKRGNVLSVVSTDGRRLALCEVSVDEKSPDFHALLSPRIVAHVKRLCQKELGSVQFALAGNKGVFDVEQGRLYATVREQGVFPEYQKLLPQEEQSNCKIPKAELLSAVRSLSCIMGDQSRSLSFGLNASSLHLVHEGSGGHRGEMTVPIEFSGDEIEIAFSVEYVLDVLQVLDSEYVELRIGDARSPVLWTDGRRFRYILAPIFVQSEVA